MSSDSRSRLLLALLYSATFAVVASALYIQTGFPLDDSYIYQVLARFAGTPGAQPPYTPGQPLAGATSKQLLAAFCNNPQDWALAYAFTAHAWRCQELYKLNAR